MVTHSEPSVGSRAPGDLERISSFVIQASAPDQLAEQIAPVAPGVHIEATVAGVFAAQVRVWRLPRVGFVSLDLSHGGRTLFGDDRDFFVLTVPLAGKAAVYSAGRVDEYVSGEAHVSHPDEPFDCRHTRGTRFLGASLDASLVRSHARALDEDGAARAHPSLRLLSTDPRHASFFRYLSWLSQELQREDPALAVPRIAWETEDLLVAMLVDACWPAEVARREGSSDELRRVEEFLATRLRTAISLPEVSTAAGVSLRTLTRAFHKKHGVGPIGFLRRRRLEATRRVLLAAEPGSESVTKVAVRYGFAHLGRFAGEYRKAFGESPSETLRR